MSSSPATYRFCIHGSAVEPVVARPRRAQRFSGTGTGSIPDGSVSCSAPGVPLVIRSTSTAWVPLTDVRVTMTFIPQHQFAGDVAAVLKAPGGSPSATLFGRIGAVTGSPNGSARHLSGTYTFVDPRSAAPTSGRRKQQWRRRPVSFNGTYATTVSGVVATSPLRRHRCSRCR